MLTCTFCGAAQTVTGSMYYFQYTQNGEKPFNFCVDAGMFQTGQKIDLFELNSRLLFPPQSLDSVILTHAHLDHCGRLPHLVKQGFGGKIYSTLATKQIAEVVMTDAAKLSTKASQESDIPLAHAHEHNDLELEKIIDTIKTKEDFTEVETKENLGLYDLYDVEHTMHRFKTYEYNQKFKIHPNLEVEFVDAGHILGSSQVILTELNSGKKVIFTGDLGNKNKPIINDPVMITGQSQVSAVFMETTYGNRLHGVQNPKRKLREIAFQTFNRGGILLIPAFSVERSQEIIYLLIELQREGKLPKLPIFLDSPMASKVLEICFKHPQLYDEKMKVSIRNQKHPLYSSTLQILDTPAESIGLNHRTKPCIIIAGSGMINGGRILKHLQFHIDNPKNTLLISGYQAEGTLGRQILEGAKEIYITGKTYPVEAKVEVINEFSAHADKAILREWLTSIINTDSNPILPTKVFLTHGESDQATHFQTQIEHSFGDRIQTFYPAIGEKIEVF